MVSALQLASRLGRARESYRSLRAAGVRPGSALLMPIRRRVPGRARNHLDLITGESFVAAADEALVPMVREIWAEESYLPAAWGQPVEPTIVDVGANVGVFAVWAAKRLEAARVIAVEPGPNTVTFLRQNLSRNGVTNAEVDAVAIGGEKRTASLYRRGPGAMTTLYLRDAYGSTFAHEAEVEVITLDELFVRHRIDGCDLLKLDCEGAEYEILFGADEATLGRIRHIAGEYHEGLNEHRADDLQAFLESKGFSFTLFPPLDQEGGHFHASRA